MEAIPASGNPQHVAADPVLPLTRALLWIIRVGFALSPSIAVVYLYVFGDPALRFIDYGFHELAIGVAIAISGFVSYVTWLCYRHSGEPFLRWVAQATTGFTLVYLPHGVLTRTADCNLWLFLLYGPASRIVMVACLFIALLRYGAPADSEEKRRSLRPFWQGVAVFALVDAIVGAVATPPTTFGPGLRIAAEYGSIALVVVCLGITAARRIASPLMRLYLFAMACFAQSSLSFLLARPWDHQWWLAHTIFAVGFFILGYGILQAFHTTRAFSLVYSQEEMMRRLEEANADLNRLAATDPLTGAANRRHFFHRFDEEVLRSQRSGTPLSLLMIDLDHFKSINDRYGHQAGDATLIAFTEGARQLLRAPDVIGRIGGEEFAVLLPESDSDQAAAVAARIRAAVEAAPILYDGHTIPVTVSIGVAQIGIDGDRVEDVVKAADARLYQAKTTGRNRVVR